MELKSKGIDSRKIILGIFFFAVILLIHRRWDIVSDDEIRLSLASSRSLTEALLDIWFNFNGKLISDGLAEVFTRIPFALWKVIDSVVYCLIVDLICMLSGSTKIVHKAAVCILVLLFPFWILSSAGYLATTTNYIYTFLGFLLACIPLQCVMTGKAVKAGHIVAAVLGGLIAANQEQTGVALIALSIVAAVTAFRAGDKKGGRTVCFFTVVYTAEFLLFFLDPGHMKRVNSTADYVYLPGFEQWSLPYKIFRGVTATYANLVFNRIALFMLVCVLVCLLGIAKKKYICVIPAIVALFVDVIDVVEFVGYFDGHYGMPDAFLPASRPRFMAFALVCVIITASLLISFWQLFEGKMRLFVLSVVCMGMGTRFMMGLTPTLFFSSFRTFTFLLFCIIIICLILMKELMALIKDDRLMWVVAFLPAVMLLVR